MSEDELEQMQYEDVLIMLNSYMEQYGARKVLQDFRAFVPKMFIEMMVQGNRLAKQPQIPALLK